jgi:trigger factor
MAAFAIAKAEGIEVSERDYKNGLDDYAEYYGYDTFDLEKEVGKEKIKKWILIEKVLRLVTDNAVDISKTTEASTKK